MRSTRIVFVVQGEGNGHISEALALEAILHSNGHEVMKVFIGSGPTQYSPFSSRPFRCPVETFPSPHFSRDTKGQISLIKSPISLLAGANKYTKSIRLLYDKLNALGPDLIVNFYEHLVGCCSFVKSFSAPVLAIAHQYFFEPGLFPFPKRTLLLEQTLLRLGNMVSSMGSRRRIALSFHPTHPVVDVGLRDVFVLPPLLRSELFSHTSQDRDFILLYVRKEHKKEVVSWHRRNPRIALRCFINDPAFERDIVVDETLQFHQLNTALFLDLLSSCRGYVSTAGFNATSEAMWLGKPVMIIPISNHPEQVFNALDIEACHAGIASESLEINKLLEFIPRYHFDVMRFRAWVEEGKTELMNHVEELISNSNNTRR